MIGTKYVYDSKLEVRFNQFSLQRFLSYLVYMYFRNSDTNTFHKTHKYYDKYMRQLSGNISCG